MSFSATVPQILDRSKTVTRRMGWKFLKPGDRLWAAEKCMGLKKGEKQVRLAMIEVVDVRRESLLEMGPLGWTQPNEDHRAYGQAEVVAEGFPDLTADEFVGMFCAMNRCVPSDEVTRIEFTYIDPLEEV